MNSRVPIEDSREDGAAGGSSLVRMLKVLDVFSVEHPAWSIESVGEALGYTTSSTYRYVRELCGAGLLASVGSGKYVLGARIIELDRLISLCDPVERAAREIVPGLIGSVEPGGLLICGLRKDHVVTAYAEFSPKTLDLSTERGRTMGLFKGAHAKAILAHLPSRRLSRLYLDYQDDIAKAGLGERWPDFQKTVAAMRKSPYVLSRRDFGRPYFALGAPIFDSDDKIVASISVTAPDDTYSRHREDQLSTILLNAAELLNRRVRAFTAL